MDFTQLLNLIITFGAFSQTFLSVYGVCDIDISISFEEMDGTGEATLRIHPVCVINFYSAADMVH